MLVEKTVIVELGESHRILLESILSEKQKRYKKNNQKMYAHMHTLHGHMHTFFTLKHKSAESTPKQYFSRKLIKQKSL